MFMSHVLFWCRNYQNKLVSENVKTCSDLLFFSFFTNDCTVQTTVPLIFEGRSIDGMSYEEQLGTKIYVSFHWVSFL